MRHERFERFLWHFVLLFALLAASLVLFLSQPDLQKRYSLPELKLVLATVFMVAGALVAVLSANRFSLEGRRYDLFLCCGFLIDAASWLGFYVLPAVVHRADDRVALWAAIAGRMLGWALIASAPFTHGRVRHRRFALSNGIAVSLLSVFVVWVACGSLRHALPNVESAGGGATIPAALTSALAAGALLHLLAVVGFANRFRLRADDLDYWLALGATLTLFASLHFIFTPLTSAGDVSQGDYPRLLGYGVLLVGVWRAIRWSEFARAVAEERARVAREIHDGLAQYLFAISTHASLLEAGADPARTIPRLKGAAQAAQQEARFAILALSSAAGRAPFDAALRRYVDVLTADGGLEVDLEIDREIDLRPDEQIELFRIVQEGLANVRKHAGARRAWVTIGARPDGRVVTVRDDGSGFASDEASPAGQGLVNMRERAAAIGGDLTLRSSPGAGTALEILLRG